MHVESLEEKRNYVFLQSRNDIRFYVFAWETVRGFVLFLNINFPSRDSSSWEDVQMVWFEEEKIQFCLVSWSGKNIKKGLLSEIFWMCAENSKNHEILSNYRQCLLHKKSHQFILSVINIYRTPLLSVLLELDVASVSLQGHTTHTVCLSQPENHVHYFESTGNPFNPFGRITVICRERHHSQHLHHHQEGHLWRCIMD